MNKLFIILFGFALFACKKQPELQIEETQELTTNYLKNMVNKWVKVDKLEGVEALYFSTYDNILYSKYVDQQGIEIGHWDYSNGISSDTGKLVISNSSCDESFEYEFSVITNITNEDPGPSGSFTVYSFDFFKGADDITNSNLKIFTGSFRIWYPDDLDNLYTLNDVEPIPNECNQLKHILEILL